MEWKQWLLSCGSYVHWQKSITHTTITFDRYTCTHVLILITSLKITNHQANFLKYCTRKITCNAYWLAKGHRQRSARDLRDWMQVTIHLFQCSALAPSRADHCQWIAKGMANPMSSSGRWNSFHLHHITWYSGSLWDIRWVYRLNLWHPCGKKRAEEVTTA